jgi:GWxTD domain-containing protein
MKNALYISLLSILLFACESPQRATSTNQAFLYNKNIGRLHPKFNIYHRSETESQLDFLLDASELQYMRRGADSVLRSSVNVSIILRSSLDDKAILDSASTRISDVSEGNNDKFIHGEIKFKASYPNAYYLEVNVGDLNRKSNYRSYQYVDKRNHYNKQNFLLLSEEGREYFGTDIASADRIQILCNNDKLTRYTVKYFKGKVHLSGPPFSLKYIPPVFNPHPDSVYSIPVPGGTGITFPKRGMYLIQSDSSKSEGITLLRFYDGFPDVTTPDLLVNALRYITNKDEFEKLHASKDKKAAVDKYWLDLAGNEDRARELISKYYNRVQDANRYFTSYTEGWRTDRGMVFLVFGPPDAVFKNGTSETWEYGMKHNATPLTFIFVHQNNLLTENDYQLRREAQFKGPWYKAVESWRQGKVYSEE